MSSTHVYPVHYLVYRSILYTDPIKKSQHLYGAPKITVILDDLDIDNVISVQCDQMQKTLHFALRQVRATLNNLYWGHEWF